MRGLLTVLCFSPLGGCGVGPSNPSFVMDVDGAERLLAQQREKERSLVRPVLVLSGYADPGLAPQYLCAQLESLFGGDRILGMDFYTALTFDQCRQRVIERTNHAFPSSNPHQTVTVDVIAHSMGGLVARYAAMDIPGKPRLRIARLFTISTPHQGAIIAKPPSPDLRMRYMREGSDFLKTLDRAFYKRDYQMTCYTRLGDHIVAPEAASPLLYPLWWVPNIPTSDAHMAAPADPRILLDIVLRLQDQVPLTQEPACPLPE
jgi:pimeloyl-ACP methyl ester carboxylesterase